MQTSRAVSLPRLEGDRHVKLIIATIKPFKLEEVREALTEASAYAA